MVARAVLAGLVLLVLVLAGGRVLATARRGAPSGRWFLVLLASALVGAASLLRRRRARGVPVVGLEPTCPLGQRILSAPRLPFRHTGRCVSIP